MRGFGLWKWLALAVALIAVVFASGILDRQKVWSNLALYYMQFENGQTVFDLTQGDSYGIHNRGPRFDLPRGKYQLKIRTFADGDNQIRIVSANQAPIEPTQIQLIADEMDCVVELDIKEDAEDLEFLVDFQEGTYLEFVDIRIYTPQYRDHAFTFAFAVLGVCMLYMLWRAGKLPSERRSRIILMAVAVMMVSAPSLKDHLQYSMDTHYHLARILNLADGLRNGQFPVRVGGYTYNGYGAATSVFYPDFLLYPAALMILAGTSLQYAVNAYTVMLHAASGAAMYLAAKRIFGDKKIGTCASILYICAIYRITDVYVRGALGEALAMAILPLFILGLWEVFFADQGRYLLLMVSAVGIFLSHMLTTLLAAGLAMGMFVLFLPRLVREKRIPSIVKAAVGTLLLCMFQLVPFLDYSMEGIGAAGMQVSMASRAIAPAQLLLMGKGELPVDPADWMLSGMPLEIGLPLIVGAALALHVCQMDEKRNNVHAALVFTAFGAMFALMSTTLFPWQHVSRLTGELVDYIQFPWRFLTLTTVLLSMAGGYGYVRLTERQGDLGIVLALTAALFAVIPTISEQTRNDRYIEYGQGATPNLLYTEYTIPGTEPERTIDRSVLLEGDIQLTAYEKDSTTITAQVATKTDAKLSFPVFGFDGYRAELDGKELNWTLGDNNRLTVELHAGDVGELRIWFAGKAIWRAAEAVSLAAAIGLAVCLLGKKRGAKAAVKSRKTMQM